MKQTLDVRQSQKLVMTPQLQQAVRLLQMSAIELSEEIQLAHETNPLLELLEEDADRFSDATENALDERLAEGESEVAVDAKDHVEFDSVDPDSGTVWDDVSNSLPIDSASARTGQTASRSDSDYLLQIPEEKVSLREHLGNQAIFLFDTEQERTIAHHIIQNINEAGYLDVELEEIQHNISSQFQIALETMEKVLAVIQHLEPIGIAARSPQECLRLQLVSQDLKPSGYETALAIIDEYLELLAARDYRNLKKGLGCTDTELAEVVEMITGLDPHPGFRFSNERTDYIVPDLLVEKKGEIWLARLNSNSMPKLAINRDYQSLISQTKGNEMGSLKEQLQNARWLLNNIEKRYQTILSVAREIVDKQQDFFNFGTSKVRPLTLTDIATPLGIHESTVSRATTGKYLLAPQGVFELKFFFSSQLTTEDGNSVSSLAIQTVIKSIVEEENRKKPISDEKICTLLSKKGIKIARRTVAKYREVLNIPSSSKRKIL